MKVIFFLFLMILFALNALYAQKNPALSKQIDSLEARDEDGREELRHGDEMQLNGITRKSLEKKITMTDSLNFPTVKRLFQQYGYPGYDLVGRKSAHNFWLLVLHQDNHSAFRDSVLIRMKSEVDKKNASPYDYSVSVDRVQTDAGKPQVYGTQVKVNKDSTSYEPKPVIEPDKLNERRKSIGLSTIEQYIEMKNTGVFDAVKGKSR